MWDNGIISHYNKSFKKDKSVGKINNTAEGYINFMKLRHCQLLVGDFQKTQTGTEIMK
jgi:hypothetical protein